MRILLVLLLLGLLLVTGLSACGNKGPLILPDDDEKTKRQE